MPTEKRVVIPQTGNQQISAAEKKIFVPTKVMQGWLVKSIELGYTASINDIAKAGGYDRSNWYKWLDVAGFVDWWDSQWQKYLRTSRFKLDMIGFKQSEKDYRFWKDMMNRTGNTIPEPAQIGAQINTQFNIPNATVERITS